MPVHAKHYVRLLAMAVLSFISMYVLMYAMVNAFENVFPNANQFYMAGMMTAPMVIIELAVMRAMYKNTKVNIAIGAASVLALVGFFAMIRMQTAVGDAQFLRSMIPHHAGAILMCERAPIQDGEIRRLCGEIIQSQQSEISLMKAMLARRE